MATAENLGRCIHKFGKIGDMTGTYLPLWRFPTSQTNKRLLTEIKQLVLFWPIWCKFCYKKSTTFGVRNLYNAKGLVMTTAILLGELSIAVGFMVFTGRALVERVEELKLSSANEKIGA